ncbi:MAG: hypothetical protein EOQ63_26720 [Mesorhizobium sp.]|nr:MAG: hypothetical protein EOQ63_26720 [Mesorhizobium sp.]
MGGDWQLGRPRSDLRGWRLAKAVAKSDLPLVGEMSGRTEGGAAARLAGANHGSRPSFGPPTSRRRRNERPLRQQLPHQPPFPHLDRKLGAGRAELGVVDLRLAADEALDRGLHIGKLGILHGCEIAAQLHLGISERGLREATEHRGQRFRRLLQFGCGH